MVFTESPELLTVTCSFLDAASMVRLGRVCSFVAAHAGDAAALGFVASLRGAYAVKSLQNLVEARAECAANAGRRFSLAHSRELTAKVRVVHLY